MKTQINKNLYSLITNKTGSPDRLAINLYKYIKTELQRSKCLELVSNYSYFVRLLKYSQETIRLKLIKLEKLGLIKRHFQRKICVNGLYYANALIVSLIKRGKA